MDAIVTASRQTAPWSHIALKASAGAAEAIPVFKVEKPTDFLHKSSQAGWKVYASGAVSQASSVFADASATGDGQDGAGKIVYSMVGSRKRLPAEYSPVAEHPTILMMGAEDTGLRSGLLKLAHFSVGIPQRRAANEVGVDSLNVSVATSLLCYEMLQKQSAKKKVQGEQGVDEALF